jgi:putative zinc finger/helix-turn-helix YgiT family protein
MKFMKAAEPILCPTCESGHLQQVNRDYIAQLGEGQKLTVPNIAMEVCDQCHAEILSLETARKIDAAIAEYTDRLTPGELTAIRESFGVDQTEMSEALGLGSKTYHRWEKGSQYPSRSLGYYLQILRAHPEVFAWLRARGWQAQDRLANRHQSLPVAMPSPFPVLADAPLQATAAADAERSLNEKRRHQDLPFDLHPLQWVKLQALNRGLFDEDYVPRAVAAEILEKNELSYVQRLASCRLIQGIDQPTPTVLGCLVLGNSTRDLIPSAYLQFLRIDGTTLSDPITDAEDVDGPLGQMINRLDQKFEAQIQTGVDVATGRVEIRKPDYPLAALAQLARNAILHRIYESTHAPIRITWFNDRIEIQNPGGPFGLVTQQNFGKPGLVDYRNPHLAEAMKLLGYVKRFGLGIQLAQEALRKNGNPPAQFTVEDTFVQVEIRKAV